MAIKTILLESFEGYDNLATDAVGDGGKWGSSSGTGVSNFSPPRTGTRALALSTNGEGWLNLDLGQTLKTVVCGFGFRMSQRPTGVPSMPILQLMQGTYTQVTLAVTTDGYLRVFKNSVTEENRPILGTGSVPLSGGVWHYLEFKVFCSNSNGKVEVRVDGVSDITLHSIDTSVTSGAVVTSLMLVAGASSAGTVQKGFDDLYVRGDGDAEYTEGGWLGPVSIVRLNPDGSAVSQWAGSYTGIDETYLDKGDYIEANASGQRFTCSFNSLASNRYIRSLQLSAAAETVSDGGRTFFRVLSSNGPDGPEQLVSHSRVYVDVMDTDPDTGSAWTKENLNLTMFGWETS